MKKKVKKQLVKLNLKNNRATKLVRVKVAHTMTRSQLKNRRDLLNNVLRDIRGPKIGKILIRRRIWQMLKTMISISISWLGRSRKLKPRKHQVLQVKKEVTVRKKVRIKKSLSMIKVISLIVLQIQLLKNVQVVQDSLVEVVEVVEGAAVVTGMAKAEVVIEEGEAVEVEEIGMKIIEEGEDGTTMTMMAIGDHLIEVVMMIKGTPIEETVAEEAEFLQA